MFDDTAVRGIDGGPGSASSSSYMLVYTRDGASVRDHAAAPAVCDVQVGLDNSVYEREMRACFERCVRVCCLSFACV